MKAQFEAALNERNIPFLSVEELQDGGVKVTWANLWYAIWRGHEIESARSDPSKLGDELAFAHVIAMRAAKAGCPCCKEKGLGPT